MHQKLERLLTLKNNNKFLLLVSCISSCFFIIIITIKQIAIDRLGQLFQIACYFAPLVPLLFANKINDLSEELNI